MTDHRVSKAVVMFEGKPVTCQTCALWDDTQYGRWFGECRQPETMYGDTGEGTGGYIATRRTHGCNQWQPKETT